MNVEHRNFLMLLVSDREEDREIARQMAVGFPRGRDDWRRACVEDYVLFEIGRKLPAVHPCEVNIIWRNHDWVFSVVVLGIEITFIVNPGLSAVPLHPIDRAFHGIVQGVVSNLGPDFEYHVDRACHLLVGLIAEKTGAWMKRTAPKRFHVIGL